MLDFIQHIPTIFRDWPIPSMLVVCMFADIVTGLMVAIATKTVSSSVSLRGMFSKVAMLIMWGVCALAEPQLKDKIGIPTGSVAALFFLINEIISIFENAAKLGAPLPPLILDALIKHRYANKPAPLVIPSQPPPVVETHIHTDKAQVDITQNPKSASQKIVIAK